jgi:hypothetical protein
MPDSPPINCGDFSNRAVSAASEQTVLGLVLDRGREQQLRVASLR